MNVLFNSFLKKLAWIGVIVFLIVILSVLSSVFAEEEDPAVVAFGYSLGLLFWIAVFLGTIGPGFPLAMAMRPRHGITDKSIEEARSLVISAIGFSPNKVYGSWRLVNDEPQSGDFSSSEVYQLVKSGKAYLDRYAHSVYGRGDLELDVLLTPAEGGKTAVEVSLNSWFEGGKIFGTYKLFHNPGSFQAWMKMRKITRVLNL